MNLCLCKEVDPTERAGGQVRKGDRVRHADRRADG